MANQFLALSLFIMLLSFFIILNAVSEFDDQKTKPVLNSLSLAFTTEEVAENLDAGRVASAQVFEGQGTTLDKIQGLFEAQIAGVEAKQNRLGTTLRLRLPLKDFEKEVARSLSTPSSNASVVTGGSDGFLVATLVSLLDSQGENQVPYKMDMVVVTTKDEQQDRHNIADKIGRVSVKIEEAGLPRKLLSAGISEASQAQKNDMIDLYFRRYQPFDLLDESKSKGDGGGVL